MADYINLGHSCKNCNKDKWRVIDKAETYINLCSACGKMETTYKQDFIDNFQCPDCNCLECTLEENKKLLATRCKNCGKQTIVLEKHTTTDHRSEQLEKQRNPQPQQNIPKCPTCSSTSIQKIGGVERGASVVGFGLFSKKINKTFKCKNCGYTW